MLINPVQITSTCLRLTISTSPVRLPLNPIQPFQNLDKPAVTGLAQPGLQFLYADPVLHSQLGSQADAIIGKRLLEFVHPDEHASARQDLGKVLESRNLHGSVTRVRYSRFGRTSTRLGYTGPPEMGDQVAT